MECWVCANTRLDKVRNGLTATAVSAQDFRITSADYGTTADLFACLQCGFVQAGDIHDVASFYEQMDDPEYEQTRAPRLVQAQKLITLLSRYKKAPATLLDVGAGSGILLEAAQAEGYAPHGVELSHQLQRKAAQMGLDVIHGTMDAVPAGQSYDVITLIDVIEHVEQPLQVLQQIYAHLADEGVFMTVTPDRKSLLARLLGWRWWHYRYAHIGYFDRATLTHILQRAGFEVERFYRPTWYFPLEYLFARALVYMPRFMHKLKLPAAVGRVVVPLNLFDSWLVVCKKKPCA
jgi:SAM-dependent methyltransferase